MSSMVKLDSSSTLFVVLNSDKHIAANITVHWQEALLKASRVSKHVRSRRTSRSKWGARNRNFAVARRLHLTVPHGDLENRVGLQTLPDSDTRDYLDLKNRILGLYQP